MSAEYRFHGTVTDVDAYGRQGFIYRDEIVRHDFAPLGVIFDKDIFVPLSSLRFREGEPHKFLRDGLRVSFLIGPDAKRPGTLVAEQVRILKDW